MENDSDGRWVPGTVPKGCCALDSMDAGDSGRSTEALSSQARPRAPFGSLGRAGQLERLGTEDSAFNRIHMGMDEYV